MRHIVTVFEGQRIEIPAGRSMRRAAEYLLNIEIGGERPFVQRSGGSIFATGFVGAVDAGSMRVEVLPKSFGISTLGTARQLLLTMLEWAGHGVRHAWLKNGSDTNSDSDMLEVVERHAARELFSRLEIGIPRRYSETEETSSIVRGRIDFHKLVRRLPTEAHLIPIRYRPLTTDNALCHLLKALTGYLSDRVTSHAIRLNLDQCLVRLGSGRAPLLTTQLASSVRLGPLEQEWAPLVELASLLAQRKNPNPTEIGATGQSTILFSLHRLFERIVRRVLSMELIGSISCRPGTVDYPLLRRADLESTKTVLSVRPDLLFEYTGGAMTPGDAKWKKLDSNSQRHGISRDDTYQLMAYMRLFRSAVGLLFYPRADWMLTDWQSEFAIESNSSDRIIAISVDVQALLGGTVAANKGEAARFAKQVRLAIQRPAFAHLKIADE